MLPAASSPTIGTVSASCGRLTAAGSSWTRTAGAALDLARVALGLLARGIDPRVQLGEALGGVAVPQVPRVPPVDVRQREAEHPRADRARHQRHAARRLGQQNGVVRAPVAPVERDALAREQPPDDLEGLLEARDAPLDGKPKIELDLHRARAEPEHEAPAEISSTVAAIFAISPGGWKLAQATSGPSRTRSVTAASAASIVHASHGPRSSRPSPR